jgi:hypothetical protein
MAEMMGESFDDETLNQIMNRFMNASPAPDTLDMFIEVL